MVEASSYLLFVAACVALILVPGPAQALVIARTIAEGPRSGALTGIGLNIGTLVHAVAAALGLSSVLAASALAFSLVKFAGAAYLIYLGIRALRPSASAAPSAAARPFGALHSPLFQSIATGVLNPKVALFFLAFLPQFVDPARGSVLVQFIVLGASMALLDTLYEFALVAVISSMRHRYSRSARVALWQNRVCGSMLIALGLRLAVQER